MQSHPFPSPATKDGFQRISGSCSVSESINLRLGILMCNYFVVDVQTIGLPLRLYLTYNHVDTSSAEMGPGWRHNFMMKLLVGRTSVTFVTDSGRHLDYVLSGGEWVPDGTSSFLPATLEHLNTGDAAWRLRFPNESFFGFDAAGRLISMADRHGNTTVLSYNVANQLVCVTEPCGRTITLGYTGSLLTSVDDPRGATTTLAYTSGRLTSVVGPEGCVTSWAWDGSGRVISRTDALGNASTFTYDTNSMLASVTDVDGAQLHYSYGTVEEYLAFNLRHKYREEGGQLWNVPSLEKTTLVDARGNTWEYRFDPSGNLWRIVDPLTHTTQLRWDPEEKLVQVNAPFQRDGNAGPFTCINNTYERACYDEAGNLLYSIDADGNVSSLTYDDRQQVISQHVSQGNFGVQGGWVSHYGSEGYVLCAFDPGVSGGTARDRVSIPEYVSGIVPSGAGFTRVNFDGPKAMGPTDTSGLDPRAVMSPDSLRRSVGMWGNPASGMQFDVSLERVQRFNLSIYSCGADMGVGRSNARPPSPYFAPLIYTEQLGRDLIITVTDATGTQTYRTYNNGRGIWATFPVEGGPSTPITVTVEPTPGFETTDAWISALTFDPYDSHRTMMTYNEFGDVTSVTDGLGNRTLIEYEPGARFDVAVYGDPDAVAGVLGVPAWITDALGRTTHFTYGDAHLNLTRIEDALGNVTEMTYDLNGNVLSVENGNHHTWLYAYDDKNRLVSVTDPLTHVTETRYDEAGNVSAVVDANEHTTTFLYSNNRLVEVVDAAEHSSRLSYDAGGNLVSVTDANDRRTVFAYDTLNRLIGTTRPDGTTDALRYDALGRLCAVTGPNGTQSDLAAINTTNAYNWLLNPGAEDPDPANPMQAMFWRGDPAYAWRDATVAHSGQASLAANESSGQSWAQQEIAIPAGSRVLTRAWSGAGAGLSSFYFRNQTYSGELQLQFHPFYGHTGSWQQLAWAFEMPSDGQSKRYTMWDFRARPDVQTGSPTYYLDDFEMYSLSTAVYYDGSGRQVATFAPDGGGTMRVFDRWGRTVQVMDASGRAVRMIHDSIGRVTQVIDADDNVTRYAYDAASNLLAFTDARGSTTEYAYDALNRLMRILYPDGTSELFTYDAASNLATYTNNRGQQRTFGYDAAERLMSVVYETDSSEVSLTYDAVGNVLTRTERNGDITSYTYDSLNRPLTEKRRRASGATTPSWSHRHTWDAVGNRTALSLNEGSRYNSAHYNQDVYRGTGTWSIPNGFNAMNLPLAFQDGGGGQTRFTYDVESRLQSVTFPSGVVHTIGTDIVGKVMSLDTTRGESTLLAVRYGYDQAGNRVGMVVADDTFDYGLDESGQLIDETVNRFVEHRAEHFRQGSGEGVTLNEETGAIELLSFDDAFTGTDLNADRWHLALPPSPQPEIPQFGPNYPLDILGVEVRQNHGLHLAFPRGYYNVMKASENEYRDFYGLRTDTGVWAAAANLVPLSGNFDVQVRFSDFQAQLGDPEAAYVNLGLLVSDDFYETRPSNIGFVGRRLSNAGNTPRQTWYASITGTSTELPTTALEGTLRIVRQGATLSLFVDGNPTPMFSKAFTTSTVYVTLLLDTYNGTGAMRFHDLVLNAPSSSRYARSGVYTSAVYDAGRPPTWQSLDWEVGDPVRTSVRFQVASSTTEAPSSWSFVGPDGTSATWFTTPPSALPSGLSGSGQRYVRYQAMLLGDGTTTPALHRADLAFSGDTDSSLTTYDYDRLQSSYDSACYDGFTLDGVAYVDRYDGLPGGWYGSTSFYDIAHFERDRFDRVNGHGDDSNYGSASLDQRAGGNLTRVTKESSSGVMTDVRDLLAFPVGDRVNSLNQLQRRDVVAAGSTSVSSTSLTYDASGNLTSKTVSGDTTTYTWDEDNRLVRVSLPTDTIIDYQYDVAGRMLTKTKTVGAGTPQTWRFEWDGMDLVREYAPSGTGTARFDSAEMDGTETYGWTGITTYYVLNGLLLGVDFDGGAMNAVISDAQGHVRLVVGANGNTVFSAGYDAWGSAPTVTENTPTGGFAARYVGAHGVRYEADTGLTYMRQRWYDAEVQRFLSRDAMRSVNRYMYGDNNPMSAIDPLGLKPVFDPGLSAQREAALQQGWAIFVKQAQQTPMGRKIIEAFNNDSTVFITMDTVNYPGALTRNRLGSPEARHPYTLHVNENCDSLMTPEEIAVTFAHEGYHLLANTLLGWAHRDSIEEETMARDYGYSVMFALGRANPNRSLASMFPGRYGDVFATGNIEAQRWGAWTWNQKIARVTHLYQNEPAAQNPYMPINADLKLGY